MGVTETILQRLIYCLGGGASVIGYYIEIYAKIVPAHHCGGTKTQQNYEMSTPLAC